MRYYDEMSAYFERVIPKALSEEWDNDGEMVVTNSCIERAVVALDCTSAAIAFARKNCAQLIITHHPLLFRAPYGIDSVKRVAACVKSNIGVLSYHTRLDEVDGGVNDCLCDTLGLVKHTKMGACGRISELDEKTDFASFAKNVGNALGVDCACVNATGSVKRVAVVSGAGKEFIIPAKYVYKCDTFITGEVSHSAMIAAKECGINLICGTHYATERVVLPFLASLTKRRFADVDVLIKDFDSLEEYGI